MDDFDNFLNDLYFQQILGHIAHNVSAVYDVWGGTMKKPVGFRAAPMCRNEAWEGAKRLT
jgi:hypothetical protein